MPQRPGPDSYRFTPHELLAGVNFGLEYDHTVYVSPALHSLLQGPEREMVLKSLRVRRLFASDSAPLPVEPAILATLARL